MEKTTKIFVIIGSTHPHSSNHKLIRHLTTLFSDPINWDIYESITHLPHFIPTQSTDNTPEVVLDFRNRIAAADGVIICSPEYVFSIPGSLKNAIEWCVATTVFTEKPLVLITASASGEKGHAELQLIMKTLLAHFVPETTLLIQGIKGKFDEKGTLKDKSLTPQLAQLADALIKLMA